MPDLSAFEKRLCNALQEGLPISQRPFAEIAKILGSNKDEVLKQTRDLLNRGVIRRIGAIINWQAIGWATTLATTSIEEEKLKNVVEAVNQIDEVSHNYLRDHYYNLWFTLRADSQKKIDEILGRLSEQFATAFHSLPVVRVFKLDVRFDAESNGRNLLTLVSTQDAGRATIDEIDKQILAGLQKGLEATEQPFDFLCTDNLRIDEVLSRINKMIREGAIRRIGAVVNHNKLGFVANAMFVCGVDEQHIIETGENLAKLNIASHCYQRKPFDGWPYNLFAMMHGRQPADIRQAAEEFVKSHSIEKWELLATKSRLKK